MRNVEVKAKVNSLRSAESVAIKLSGSKPRARIRQVDTYFNVKCGRLKLRKISGSENRTELIFYRRANLSGPKTSDYFIVPVDDALNMKSLLAAAFGIRAVVDKKRTVYLYKNVRIHLDKVKGLGEFIEFEAVLRNGARVADGRRIVNKLLGLFGIDKKSLLANSYSDMAGA